MEKLISFCFLYCRKFEEQTNQTNKSGSSSSNSSSFSTVEILEIISKLQNSKYRPSTKNTYMTVWRIFNESFVKLDKKPDTWENRILLFAGHLVQERQQSATIKSYSSAIKAVLLDNKIAVNEINFY